MSISKQFFMVILYRIKLFIEKQNLGAKYKTILIILII